MASVLKEMESVLVAVAAVALAAVERLCAFVG
jgi:hypothetical protein